MKDIKFSTRMSSQDRETIKTLARQTGLSMSDYVTACCLGKQVIVIDGLKEVLSALRAIGNNLNQLTVLSHMGRISTVDLDSTARQLSEIKDVVREIAERKRW